MKSITVKKREINFKEYIKRTALEKDFETLIEEPTTVLNEKGEVIIIYDILDIDTSDIVSALKRIKYHEGARARGLKSKSRIFGYRPRLEMRADFCSSTSMSAEHQAEHGIVSDLALTLEEYYKKYNTTGYEKHLKLTETIKDAWRIHGKSVFTSGIINKNNPLKYHFDTGNFNDVYSCMIVFKGGTEGGFLSLPEYGIGFALPNNAIFLFDGQSILHGVTPIYYKSPESYRFSIVYYSLKRMWQCLEINEELARVRQKKTKRERLRVKNPLTEEERLKKKENDTLLRKRYGKQ